ncbi:CheY-P phosphatase CheC [Thermotoga profunda]|uniref:CheY-P phosphatase CheC n=1 Tax=Thermotoga profunda TaxID=1508420 RepID=UPI000596EB41|nr:CheY-P phosphatase CheC [Thermotoga profunda]
MQLTERQLDLLKEIGNIGTGNAATALSTLTGKKIEITVPNAETVPIEKIVFMFPQPEDIVIGIRMVVKGDVDIDILLILDRHAAKKILTDLLGSNCEDITQLDEISASALKEIGNIMCGSYITALAEFTQLYLDPLPPELSIDMLVAIVSEAILASSNYEDEAIFVETELTVEEIKSATSQMFLIPGKGSLEKIFSKVGL